ncbi:histidine-rich glycoprotein [Rhineura floridana]|uniref:histidine-rich glycoprotein n=1 Tax=Rhineura floridana TaxID=261503 RepID=UPI002AC803C7|nr:histidine-rich glycoprotein [Rhineura floridana]
MELLVAAVFMTVLLGSHGQSQTSVVSADCNDVEIEEDAGLTLDLINKHRRDGYIFALFRVADAHVQHAGNASIVYLTLDVLETECSVLSRRKWSSCEHRQFYPYTDFGQCKAVLYINRVFKKGGLYGYNCTVSPVPPELYECRRCPVRTTVVQDVEGYTKEANRILERYNQESNQTHYFKVEEIQKVFSAVADRTVYIVEFTIKETSCPRSTLAKNISACEFLPDRYAHMGFCTGRVVKEDPSGVEIQSCEIYDIQYGWPPFLHLDSGEHYHRWNESGQGCRYPPNGPPHWHRHPHRRHYHHHYPHHPHRHHHHHRGCRHQHGHRHGRRCPPLPHHGPAWPTGHHNSSEQYPDFPPPPGPYYPPPPPGGPHHLPPSKYPPPPAGPPPPPPPHRPHGNFPPPPKWPHDRPPPPKWPHDLPPPPKWPHDLPPPPKWPHDLPPPPGRWHGHRHDCRYNDTSAERSGGGSSEEHNSFRDHHSFHNGDVGSIYYIPVVSQHDVLQAPGAHFFGGAKSPHGRHHETTLPGIGMSEKPVPQPFPEVPSESKLCPGKPKHDRPDFLSLYPH